MGKLTIKSGEPQPEECPKCKEKMGYQTSTYLKTHYNTEYSPDGEMVGGFYSDCQPVIRRNKTAYCVNCGGILPFWVNQENQ